MIWVCRGALQIASLRFLSMAEIAIHFNFLKFCPDCRPSQLEGSTAWCFPVVLKYVYQAVARTTCDANVPQELCRLFPPVVFSTPKVPRTIYHPSFKLFRNIAESAIHLNTTHHLPNLQRTTFVLRPSQPAVHVPAIQASHRKLLPASEPSAHRRRAGDSVSLIVLR